MAPSQFVFAQVRPSPVPSPLVSPTPSPNPEQNAKLAAREAALRSDLNSFVSQKTARIVIESSEKNKIEDLKWSEDRSFPVHMDEDPSKIALYADVEAAYDRPGWTIIHDTKVIKPASGLIQIRFSVEGKNNKFQITAVGPNGDLQTQTATLVFDEWNHFQATRYRRYNRRLTLTPGLGITQSTYEQTAVSQYDLLALTGKISLLFQLRPPTWDVALSAYYTLLPFRNSLDDEITIRFFGANFRLGYTFIFIPEPWRVSIQFGYYYTTTHVTDNLFGYQAISGPQIYPTIRRVLASGDAITAYAKFSPIASQFQFLAFSNREIAAGLSYGYLVKNGFLADRMIILSADFADLYIAEQDSEAKSRSMTVGIGVGI